jgi:hypothetical protein
MKQAALRNSSARRPLARSPVTKRASWVAWDDLGVLEKRYGCNPTQRVVITVRFSQLRRPATLLPLSRLLLRVGARFRAGQSDLGVRAFSSGSTLASPDFRASFVLRDRGHIKCQLRGAVGSLRPAPSYQSVAAESVRARNVEAGSTSARLLPARSLRRPPWWRRRRRTARREDGPGARPAGRR